MYVRLLAALLLPALLSACGAAPASGLRDAEATPMLQEPARPVLSSASLQELQAKPGQEVVLLHCGVAPISFEDVKWEVTAPPFDNTNAPDSFSGFGDFERAGNVLDFTDELGAAIRFTLDDGVADKVNCA